MIVQPGLRIIRGVDSKWATSQPARSDHMNHDLTRGNTPVFGEVPPVAPISASIQHHTPHYFHYKEIIAPCAVPPVHHGLV